MTGEGGGGGGGGATDDWPCSTAAAAATCVISAVEKAFVFLRPTSDVLLFAHRLSDATPPDYPDRRMI